VPVIEETEQGRSVGRKGGEGAGGGFSRTIRLGGGLVVSLGLLSPRMVGGVQVGELGREYDNKARR